MTILLRLFLYLILTVCLVWGAIIVTGPRIIQVVLQYKYDNEIEASGVTVSPKLEIVATQIIFNEFNAPHIGTVSGELRGFSFGLEDLFSKSPKVRMAAGPTSFDGLGDWNKLSMEASLPKPYEFEQLSLSLQGVNVKYQDSFLEYLNLNMVYDTENKRFSNIQYNGKDLMIKGETSATVDVFDGTAQALFVGSDQRWYLQGGQFDFSNLQFSKYDLTVSNGVVQSETKGINAQLILSFSDVEFLENGRIVEGILDLSADRFPTAKPNKLKLQLSDISLPNGHYYSEDSGLKSAFVNLNFSDPRNTDFEISGVFNSLEITNNSQFIATLPDASVGVFGKVTNNGFLEADYSLSLPSSLDVALSGRVAIDSGGENVYDCFDKTCTIYDMETKFDLDLADYTLNGEAKCKNILCNDESSFLRLSTTNTAKFFDALIQTRALSPLISAGLYGLLTSGTPVGEGHVRNF